MDAGDQRTHHCEWPMECDGANGHESVSLLPIALLNRRLCNQCADASYGCACGTLNCRSLTTSASRPLAGSSGCYLPPFRGCHWISWRWILSSTQFARRELASSLHGTAKKPNNNSNHNYERHMRAVVQTFRPLEYWLCRLRIWQPGDGVQSCRRCRRQNHGWVPGLVCLHRRWISDQQLVALESKLVPTAFARQQRN